MTDQQKIRAVDRLLGNQGDENEAIKEFKEFLFRVQNNFLTDGQDHSADEVSGNLHFLHEFFCDLEPIHDDE